MAPPTLRIDDFIAADSWWGGISARYVNYWLREHENDPEILVIINSPGGDAIEGVAIYHALEKHSAKILIEVEGLAASAASVLAMAGDVITVRAGSFMMVHESWGFTQGPAEDHEKQSILLRKVNGALADIYAARTGQTKEKCLEIMAADTWMTGEECIALGFADVVIPAKAKPVPKKNDASAKAQASVRDRYKNAPAAALSLFGQNSAYKATIERAAPALAMAASEVELGDRVQVRAGLEHDGMHAGATGTVQILHGGPAVGIVFDGMDDVHKWYAPDEIDVVEEADAADGEGDDAAHAAKKKKKPMQPMKMEAHAPLNMHAATAHIGELAHGHIGELANHRAR